MNNAEKTEVLAANDQPAEEQNAQVNETAQAEVTAVPKEKTAEELALEQGYYACCFRSH